jgi:hypothetical protein
MRSFRPWVGPFYALISTLNNIALNYKGDDPAKGWITRYADARRDKEGDVWD